MAGKRKRGSRRHWKCDCIQCRKRRARKRTRLRNKQPVVTPVGVPLVPSLGTFLLDIGLRGLESWARDHGYIGAAPHPEALEEIETTVDERQLGRSEVIGEIARPKKN